MKNVYFKSIKDYNEKENINDTTYKMLSKIVESENVNFKECTPLKVHFGEMGNDTYITTDNFNGIKKYLKEKEVPTCYIETNVLYKGSRTYTKDHIETAKSHGFTDLDIVIADGDTDNEYQNIEINKEFFSHCKIGYKFKDYSNYIILAHFKGHGLAGFGGSIKQLAMGFASRGGKLNQHSDAIPVIDKSNCIRCGRCKNKCPVDAIDIIDKAVINPDKCIGCASCSSVCPVDVISNTWDSSNFFEKLAEYAYAASKDKENVYFNFAFNITKECDCNGSHMKFISDNIGVFASTDPVAVDTATLDMLQKANNSKMFDTGRIALEHGEKIGLGSREYNLIEL